MTTTALSASDLIINQHEVRRRGTNKSLHEKWGYIHLLLRVFFSIQAPQHADTSRLFPVTVRGSSSDYNYCLLLNGNE